jgi:hypothetical protein
VIKYLPKRQYHIWVPLEIHPRIREPEYKLRRLPPYLRHLLRKVVTPFATTVANQNLGPPPQPWVSRSWYLQHHPRPQRRHSLQEKGHQDGAKRKLPPACRPTMVQLHDHPRVESQTPSEPLTTHHHPLHQHQFPTTNPVGRCGPIEPYYHRRYATMQ